LKNIVAEHLALMMRCYMTKLREKSNNELAVSLKTPASLQGEAPHLVAQPISQLLILRAFCLSAISIACCRQNKLCV